jgi:hypothetical protein
MKCSLKAVVLFLKLFLLQTQTRKIAVDPFFNRCYCPIDYIKGLQTELLKVQSMISPKLIFKIILSQSKWYRFAILFIIIQMIEFTPVVAQSSAHDFDKTTNAFKVVAFLPSWSLSQDALPLNSLTHIQYSFIRPTEKGGLTTLDNPQKLKDVVTKAHANKVLVGIVVGGWSNLKNEDFERMASNPETRRTFIHNLLSLITKYQLDGVDVNWQYPSKEVDQTNYTKLITELGNALHEKGKYLSATVAAYGERADEIQDQVFNAVDFLNLLAYDGGVGEDHSSYQFAASSINYWIERGVPSSKVVLGLPFHAQPTWKSYRTLIDEGANGNVDVYQGNFYNGLYTVKQKTKLVLDRNVGGVMISDITQDATGEYSLVRAIHQAIPRQLNSLRKPVPFDGIVHDIPGIIEAEHFDLGAEGIAYHDLMPENSGGAFRDDAVDVEVNGSTKNDYKVASIQAGEWLMYSVNVTTSGPLTLEAQVASTLGNKAFHIEMDGVNVSGPIKVPNTGGWENWQSVSITTSSIKRGKKLMRVVMDDGDFNLNRISFSSSAIPELVQTQDEPEVKEEEVTGLTLHPNPGTSGVSQDVTLTFDSPNQNNISVALTDISGNVLFKSIYTSSDGKTVNVSLPDLSKGIYMLRIRSDKKSWVERYYVK